MFARKIRAIAWLFVAILFTGLLFAMIVAMTFGLAEIHWTHVVFVVVCLGFIWIGVPEDPDEKEERTNNKRRRNEKP